MKYQEFIENQNRIYEEFKDTSKVEIEGLKPNIQENKGGYIIALRHSKNIINTITKITIPIYKEVESIKYDENNIHTTLATYKECIRFEPNEDELELLYTIAKNNIAFLKGIKINYSECLINQDSIIVAGTPNKHFIEYINSIEKEAIINNIKLKRPWGTHITISRFLNNIEQYKILKLLDIVRNITTIGVSNPLAIDVGYYNLVNAKFNIEIYKTIDI